MELTAELLGAGIVGVLVVAAAVGNYLRSLRAPPPTLEKSSAVLAGIGLGYVEREQMERLIAEVKRIADAIGDKKAADINDKLEHMVERLDSMQSPPRRR